MTTPNNCTVSDDKLLLLTHGELGLAESWLLKRHVASCAKCRRSAADMASASAAIASVVRDSAAPAWHHAGVSVAHVITVKSALAAIAATATIGAALTAVVAEYHYYNPSYSQSYTTGYIAGQPHYCHGMPAIWHLHHHHHRTPPTM